VARGAGRAVVPGREDERTGVYGRAVHATMITADGPVTDVSWPSIEQQLAVSADGGGMFWLDLVDPSDEDIDELGARFHLHPLSVDDSKEFDQHAKVVSYDGYVLLVSFGIAGSSGELTEIHSYYATSYLVTLRKGPLPAIAEVMASAALRDALRGDPVVVLYLAATALLDSFETTVDAIDDRLEQLETEILRQPEARHLEEIGDIKERVGHMRRALFPSRSAIAVNRGTVAADLPGLTPDGARYIADYYDEHDHLGSDLEALADHAKAVLDLHVNMTSIRQNEVMRQLSVVATIFLPLTFLTGFFGQNFASLLDIQSSVISFVLLAIGLEVVSVVVLLTWMRRHGWNR
jgi:magnesium transporter